MDTTERMSVETATPDLLTAAGGNRCATCKTPLASDQRYCIACGERRGKTRFSLATMAAEAAPAPVAVARAPRRPRASASTTLVAGVATLLLAMGVGFMIGQNGANNNGASRAAAVAPQVIKIDAGGGAGNVGGTQVASSKVRRKAAAAASIINQKVHITPKLAAAATAAANKVLGSSANNLAPVTVQPGQACAHGAGCHNGKFTGDFFQP